MLHIFNRYFAALFIAGALSFISVAAQAEPADGWQAFTTGDHAKAEAIWRLLAEKGDRNAAFGLGMLEQTRNQFEQAARWYEQAARAGLTSAQVLLGSMYIDGRGVPRDGTLAYAWFNRANLDGHANAARVRDAIAVKLTSQELAQAKALSESFASPK